VLSGTDTNVSEVLAACFIRAIMMEAEVTLEYSTSCFFRKVKVRKQDLNIHRCVMEAANTSETSLNIYQTALHSNPEDSRLLS
jgi:hypothetical protein